MKNIDDIKMTEDGRVIYSIPSFKYEAFKKKIKYFQKKAEKFDLEPITYSELGTEIKEIIYTYDYGDIDSIGLGTDGLKREAHKVKFYNIVLDGFAPKVEGWKLIARLYHQTGDTFIFPAPGQEVPAELIKRDAQCEHCGREWLRRNDTFIIEEVDNPGNFKQVGRNCLADFLRSTDADKIGKFFEQFSTFIESSGDWGEDDIERAGGWNQIDCFDIKEILIKTSAVARVFGWLGNTQAKESDYKLSTAMRVMNWWYDSRSACEVLDSDKEKATQIIEWVKGLSVDEASKNSYMINIWQLGQVGYATYQTMGYACSMLKAYDKAMEIEYKKTKWQEEKKGLKYYGEIGQRDGLKDLVFQWGTSFETNFGVTYLYKFQKENYVFVWFASKAILDDAYQELEVGDVVDLKGTVKEHKEFKSEKQTIITRCKVSNIKKIKKENNNG